MIAGTSRLLLVLIAGLSIGACGNDNPQSEAACPSPSSGSVATLRLATGTLCGTIEMPTGSGPHPVALIVAGSGPTDRDGNSNSLGIRTDAYRALAEELARRGMASLRYDKRGVAASARAATAEADLRPQDEADDVAAWLSQLKSDARFSSVVVVGHSEGSLLGILAMQKVAAASFISLAGPGRRMAQVFREQLARQLAQLPDATLLEKANQILDELEAGHTVADVPAPLAIAFRPSVQPYLIALLRYEASAELAKIATPTLIAQGTTDVQIAVADAHALAAARPDARVLIVDGMCHVLKMASLDDADQRAALTDPARPLAPALLEGIDAFLHREDHGILGD